MSKINRRTNLQIIKDDLEELIIYPKEVSVLSFKTVFSRVKNIKDFKEVMNTLMAFVTNCIYTLEGEGFSPRERYELITKAIQVCEVIKTKKKMKITGLSTRYQNEIHNFLVEDGEYFLKIRKKELALLKEESLNDYTNEEVKELMFKKKRFKALYGIIKNNRNLFKQTEKTLSRLWLYYLDKQISRDKTDLGLKKIRKEPFFLICYLEKNWVEKLDIDLQIRFYKDFSLTIAGDEVIFDGVGFKSSAIPIVNTYEVNPSFKEREDYLLQQSELSDAAFEYKLSELQEEFSEVVMPSNTLKIE